MLNRPWFRSIEATETVSSPYFTFFSSSRLSFLSLFLSLLNPDGCSSFFGAYLAHLLSCESKAVPSKRKVVSHLWNTKLLSIYFLFFSSLLLFSFTRAFSPLLSLLFSKLPSFLSFLLHFFFIPPSSLASVYRVPFTTLPMCSRLLLASWRCNRKTNILFREQRAYTVECNLVMKKKKKKWLSPSSLFLSKLALPPRN